MTKELAQEIQLLLSDLPMAGYPDLLNKNTLPLIGFLVFLLTNDSQETQGLVDFIVRVRSERKAKDATRTS